MLLLNSVQEHTPFLGDWIPTITILVIIFLLCIVYYRYFHRIKGGFIRYIRYFLFPFTFASGSIIFFIGYQVGNSHSEPHAVFPNILESFFSTTRLFILGNDLVEIEQPFKHNHFFHAMFALTAALAAFIFVSFMLHVFFRDWLVRLRIYKTNDIENHFFFGINKSSLALASDLIKNNRKRLIVFINDNSHNENQHLYSELPDRVFVIKRKSLFDSIHLDKEEGLLGFLGGIHVYSNDSKNHFFQNINILKKMIGKTETHLYFLTDNEDWNIQYAKTALKEIAMLNCKVLTRLHVSTYSELSDKHFQEWSRLKWNNISVIIHHYATIVSRQLIAEHHPVDFVEIDPETATVKSNFNALIIGFGQVGKHVLRKIIEQGQFVGSTFHATVIDKSISTIEGRFEHLYPEAKINYNLGFYEVEVGDSRFYKRIKQIIEKTNYIVVALGNDNLNIQTALEILEIHDIRSNKNIKIFIQMEAESHWIETLKEFNERVCFFGDSSDIYSEVNILQSVSEIRGRSAHNVYNKIIYPNPDNLPFDEITLYEQLSNISVAEHLYAKVKLLGYNSMQELLDKFSSNDEYKSSLSDIQRLNLSITEHMRWNAFHYVHGWTTIPIDEIEGVTPDERNRNRKKSILKQHACLTSWEKLKDLETTIGRNMQEADIISVENLYNFIDYNIINTNDEKN